MKCNLVAAVVAVGGLVGCSGEIGAGSDFQNSGPTDGVVHAQRPQGTEGDGERSIASVAGAPQAIYLNRNGRTYTAGWDDSANGVSSVVQGQGKQSATIPPAPWSNAQWTQFVACVQDEYARFNLVVTDQRPATGTYIEGAIGGTGTELGYGSGVGGVAPVDTYQCRPIAQAVVFIFAGNSWATPTVACEIAAQELGHAVVPMDHEYLAADPMTYLNFNGHKVFQDQDAQCGEYQTRQCFCKRATQNSVQLLYSTLGPHSTTPPPNPNPTPPPAPGDTTKPVVGISSPSEGSTQPANANLSVTVHATDNVGVTAVSLYWAFSSRDMPCDNSISGVTCSQAGADYTWTFAVGSGDRQFYATATDAAGNKAQSATAHITLGTPASQMPPPDAPPQLRVDSPSAGAVLHPGGALNLQATVHDDGTITEVIAHWTNSAGTTDFPMHESTAGVFTFASTLSASAAPGARSFTITATDNAGNQTTSASVGLVVQ